MRTRRPCAASVLRAAFVGFRFPPDVIVVAVRWYLRFGLSYRDVEQLLAERGVEVDHVTIYRWVQRFTPLLAEAARPCRHTERSTSSGRSSTCSDPHSAMPRPHAGSSNRPSARPGSPRSRSSPIGRHLPDRAGRVAPRGVASYRPVRQQPCRGGSRQVEGRGSSRCVGSSMTVAPGS